MATLIPNTFSFWELTDEEEKIGSIFTETQKQVLQNQIAMCAEEKLRLPFDPADPLLYAQQESFKRGQIEILQYLVDTSDAYLRDMQIKPPEEATENNSPS